MPLPLPGLPPTLHHEPFDEELMRQPWSPYTEGPTSICQDPSYRPQSMKSSIDALPARNPVPTDPPLWKDRFNS